MARNVAGAGASLMVQPGHRMPVTQWPFFALFGLALAGPLRAASAADIQKDLLAGRYDTAIQEARDAVKGSATDEDAQVLLVRALLSVGRYAEADAAAEKAVESISSSIRLRWIAREAALDNGQSDAAAALTTEIARSVQERPWSYRDAANLVVFARAALLLGADPKEVMDKVLDFAEQRDPTLRDVFLAKGELALAKHDFQLAAKAYQDGLQHSPDDPDLHFGLAQAYADGDRAAMLAELDAALKANPRHVPSLLLLADNAIDSEDYDGASKRLEQALAVNPWEPEAWAYKALLAHLRNRPADEDEDRRKGLRFSPKNPLVDRLIGKKLAEKYRFAEAAAAERSALAFDPGYLPAEIELANDLLRLGQEKEGWRLAEEVHSKDDYDVEAYNLTTLHDTMEKYTTLMNGDFVVRMTAAEAKIYGNRALDLLERERKTLTAKYGVDLVRPTYVEIFGDQKDFAVRTFGIPNIGGFLGVCFGRVVTVNGPAANSAHPSNWETVLWHEFCHVVTLQITENKMPRWLSEGISVYEESQADPSWGMHMNPRYRDMILNGQLTPISRLSGAFLAPPSLVHLQFAYFESSLVVEFIITRYGFDSLKGILRDLGAGREINEAIAAHTAPLPELEKAFAAFARSKADALAPGLKWDRPAPSLEAPGSEAKLAEWAEKNPDNTWALRLRARQLLEAKSWAEARDVTTHFLALYPTQIGDDSAYLELAAAERGLGDTGAERTALTKLEGIDDNATDACLRLMDLAQQSGDWKAARHYAERYLAVNPLVDPPYRCLARAAEAMGDTETAIGADRTLLLLHPPDPSEVHFQLADLLWRSRDPEARRQVLEALEDAPRYREALSLLLEIDGPSAPAAAPSP